MLTRDLLHNASVTKLSSFGTSSGAKCLPVGLQRVTHLRKTDRLFDFLNRGMTWKTKRFEGKHEGKVQGE